MKLLPGPSIKYEPLTTYNLPTTLNLSKWGFLLINTPISALIRRGEHSQILVSINGNVRSVSILSNDVVIYSFTDTVLSLELDHFTLALPLFEDGTLVTYKNGLQTSLQKPKNPLYSWKDQRKTLHWQSQAGPSFFASTLDLETKVNPKTKLLEVISACLYSENKWGDCFYDTYFINDYKNSKELILAFIASLFCYPFNERNDGRVIYVHNFSGGPALDSVFILQTLAEFTEKLKIIKKDDKIISLKVSKSVQSKNDTTITFLDSMSILPAKLKELGPAFGVGFKGEFDLAKVNKCKTRRDFEAISGRPLSYQNTINKTVLYSTGPQKSLVNQYLTCSAQI